MSLHVRTLSWGKNVAGSTTMSKAEIKIPSHTSLLAPVLNTCTCICFMHLANLRNFENVLQKIRNCPATFANFWKGAGMCHQHVFMVSWDTRIFTQNLNRQLQCRSCAVTQSSGPYFRDPFADFNWDSTHCRTFQNDVTDKQCLCLQHVAFPLSLPKFLNCTAQYFEMCCAILKSCSAISKFGKFAQCTEHIHCTISMCLWKNMKKYLLALLYNYLESTKLITYPT